MPRPKTSGAELDRIKEQILMTATRMFADLGYSGIGMRDLAKESGVFTPQLYQFFSDKRDLYAQCCERIFAKNLEILTEACNACDSTADKVMAFTLTLIKVMSEDVLSRLYQRMMVDHDVWAISALTGNHYKSEFDQLAEWVAELVGPEKAQLKAYGIYAYATGMLNYRPMTELSSCKLPELEDPQAIARFVLNSLIPEVFDAAARQQMKPTARRRRAARS